MANYDYEDYCDGADIEPDDEIGAWFDEFDAEDDADTLDGLHSNGIL